MGFKASVGNVVRNISRARHELRLLLLAALVAQISITASFNQFLPLEPAVEVLTAEEKAGTPLQVIESQVAASHYQRVFIESLNSANGDGTNYMVMARGGQSYPAYSLRPLVPFVVGTITSVFASPQRAPGDFYCIAQLVMTIMNCGLLLVTAILTYRIAKRYCRDELFCSLIAVIAVVNYSVLQTAPFFMLDVASIFLATAIVYLILTRRYLAAALTLTAGVLTKEVLVIYALLFALPLIERDLRLGMAIVYFMLPIAAFVGLRVVMGADPLSMQYGWRISQGEISLHYIRNHFATPFHAIACLAKIAAGLGVVGGIAAISVALSRRKAELWIMAAIVLLVVFATLMLSSRVVRVLQISYPIMVVGAAIGWQQLFFSHPSRERAAATCEIA
jgi:hypothetical protein